MQPILQTTIRYRKNKVGKLGVPSKVIVSLYPTHIEFVSKSLSKI